MVSKATGGVTVSSKFSLPSVEGQSGRVSGEPRLPRRRGVQTADAA